MQTVGESQRLLSNRDLAALMGWSIHTVHQRRYRGASLPRCIVIEGTIRYRPEDVEAWLDAHTTTTTENNTHEAIE